MRQQLLLGTAQWGLDYGVTNTEGRIPEQKLEALVQQARHLGIGVLDTAPVYGDAESRVQDVAGDFAVQTKVSASGRSEAEIVRELEDSLLRLDRERVWSVLVHDWPELTPTEGSRVTEILSRMRKSGLVGRFGVSIYEEQDLEPLLTDFSDIDVVQIPTSIIDQRLRASEALTELRGSGVVVQARSIFLQGVLLNAQSDFATQPGLANFGKQVAAHQIDAMSVCVSYIRTQSWIDEVVVGVTSAAELKEIFDAFQATLVQLDWDIWASTDESLLDPRSWARD